MARGNGIIVSAQPNGRFTEGIIGAGLTPSPGTIMQLQLATALVGGRHTWEIYNADIDGGRPKGPIIVLLPDFLQGRLATTAYAAGERAFGYVPLPGDELNLLWSDADTGTSTNDVAIGTTGIVRDGFGTIIATTGSPENEVCILLEALNNLSGNTLGWSQWTGY